MCRGRTKLTCTCEQEWLLAWCWPLWAEGVTFRSWDPDLWLRTRGSCTGFLTRSNIIRNAIRVNKSFSKPRIAVLKSSWRIGKAGPYLEWIAISVRTMSPPWWKRSSIINLPSSGQPPGTMGHGAILGYQCSFLLLIGRAHSAAMVARSDLVSVNFIHEPFGKVLHS